MDFRPTGYTATVKSFLLLLLAAAGAVSAQTPDVLYVHGDILTGAHLRPGDASATPARVSALAIARGKIVAAGTDADMIKLKGAGTRVVDLKGAFAMPAFNDAHTHIAPAGRQKLSVDLDGVTSLAEMQERIRAYAATTPAGTWLLGGGWDHTLWASKTLPTRGDIDAVSGGHPAFLERTDGHIAIANTAALAAAGITASTPDPAGAKIDHDGAGGLTGIIRERPAYALILPHIPPPTPERRTAALKVAMADAMAHGVTSVQDFSDWDDFLALEAMERAGELRLRVSEWLDFNLPVETLRQRQSSHPQDDPLLHTGMLKGFMDGSLGSRTAALIAPYADDPGNSGIPRYEQKALNKLAVERAEAGFQLGFHAIGDRANSMALNAFDESLQARQKMMAKLLPGLEKTTGARLTVSDDPRYRIEHAQVVAAGDFDRFARLHVVASMQPSHLLTDMKWAGDRLGPARTRYSYAWRSFLNHGVPLAFGTDYPVESINPFRGLYSAVTRMNEAGTQTYQPQERLTIQEAIYAYTQGSAYAQRAEHSKGRLEPGFLADIVVLDRDPTRATPQELLHTTVLRTVLGGETVYEAR